MTGYKGNGQENIHAFMRTTMLDFVLGSPCLVNSLLSEVFVVIGLGFTGGGC